MASEHGNDRKMSDSEGLMWRLEKDPYLSSTFANISILDRPPDFERLLRRIERASVLFARLRQRVQPMPVNMSPPIWVDDPDFDIRYHVRRVALPKPGSMDQLREYATLVALDPFERTRPLWSFHVVEGLRGGRAALVSKMHHTITDGEGGVQLSLQYLDFERDAPEPPPVAPADLEVAELLAPSPGDVLRGWLGGPMKLPLGIARQIKDLLADPTSIPQAGSAASDTVRGIVSQLADTEKAKSPLWTARSLRRNLQTLRVPYRATRDRSRELGGTLNTAFLTAAAEAAGRYHRELGEPVEHLRASMAISTRTADSGANAFSLARMLVPTGEMPIEERFGLISDAAQHARDGASSASLDTLASVANALPTSVATRVARQQAQTIDFATSNVRGTPLPVFIAGAEILENYPVGPLAGVAFNLTLLSHVGSLDMGVHIDAAAVAEPERLQRCLVRAFADFAPQG